MTIYFQAKTLDSGEIEISCTEFGVKILERDPEVAFAKIWPAIIAANRDMAQLRAANLRKRADEIDGKLADGKVAWASV